MPPQRRTLKYNKPNSDWFTPSKLRNFLIEDHLTDYINTASLRTATTNGNIFTKFGQDFEDKVIEYLRRILPFDIPSNLDFDETAKALNEGEVRIIYQGSIVSENYKLFGHPDLIVRGDTLRHIFREMPNNLEIKPEAYYIVEIKSKKMTFTTAGDGIRNTDTSIKYYKAQCYIYQKCLNEMLLPDKQHCNIAFILSRMPNGCLNCFQMPAVMNFQGRLDNYVPDLVRQTLNIKRGLVGKCEKFPEEIVDFSKVAEELYPNMSIQYDNYNIKEEIAKELGDITLLFQCGRRQRQIAFEKGINSWRHPDCNGTTLNVANAFRRHVDDIININKGNELISLTSSPFGDELQLREDILDIYLDFEVGTDVLVENFETFPIANRISIIYLIGLGKTEKQGGAWKYQPFLARDLSSSERAEIQNFQQFVRYLNQIQKENNVNRIRVYHWGHAELTWIKALKERSNVRMNLDNFIFIDLCSLIKKHHFVVKGAFKYGLKEIAKAMKDNGMIETSWDLNDSILSHWQALKDENYEPILKYNEVDCKVMWEIVEYLRKTHM